MIIILIFLSFMKLRIDRMHHSQPSGGWGYVVKDGPVLSAPKLTELIDQLGQYREANGLPRGDPEHDIALSYADAFPWLIKRVSEEDDEVVDAEAWIHRAWKSCPLRLAEPRLRDERFDHCLKCKHFEPLVTDDLSREAARRLLVMNPAKHRGEHGWCLWRGFIPSVAVQVVNPQDFADFTEKHVDCWIGGESGDIKTI